MKKKNEKKKSKLIFSQLFCALLGARKDIIHMTKTSTECIDIFFSVLPTQISNVLKTIGEVH